jgi:hypothetical protein
MNCPVDYTATVLPDAYHCSRCDARGVRLYRQYQTLANNVGMLCRACALKDQKKDAPDNHNEHSIGWLVAAVPTEEGDTFWGYTSVPPAGVIWWNRLPSGVEGE